MNRRIQAPAKLLLLWILLICPIVAGAADAGTVLFVSGGASVTRGTTTLPVARGMALQSGDVLQTESDGRVQWQMSDESLFVIKPNSRFAIDEYEYSGGKTDSGKSFYSLLKGGFATISGFLKSDTNYGVKTPVATLGIRGTKYRSILCQGDCKASGGSVPDGLYVAVDTDALVVSNGAGSVTAKAGQYVYVADANTAPVILDKAPAIFLDDEFEFEFDFDFGIGVTIERPVSAH